MVLSQQEGRKREGRGLKDETAEVRCGPLPSFLTCGQMSSLSLIQEALGVWIGVGAGLRPYFSAHILQILCLPLYKVQGSSHHPVCQLKYPSFKEDFSGSSRLTVLPVKSPPNFLEKNHFLSFTLLSVSLY